MDDLIPPHRPPGEGPPAAAPDPPAPGPPASPGRWAGALACALPAAAALVLYGSAASPSQWFADDVIGLATHAHHGQLLGEWTHPTFVWSTGQAGHVWRPLMATLQHLVALAFGRTPEPQRWLNAAVHALNAALVAWAIMRLGRRRSGESTTSAPAAQAPAQPPVGGGLAAIAGGLALSWAVHPALADAVGWASALADLLSATFMLGALGWVAGAGGRRPWAAVLMVLAACLAKESAVAFAPVPALVAFARGERRGAAGLLVAGGAAAGLFLGLHRLITGLSLGATSLATSPLDQLRAWLGYLGWLARVPAQAGTAHLFDPADLAQPVAGAITALGLALLAALAARRRPRALPELAAGAAAWALLLLPAGVATPMAGPQPFRYLYAPSAVAFALLGAALAAALPALGGGGARAASRARLWWGIAALGVAVWVLTGAPRALRRLDAWRGPVPLWQAEATLEPHNPYALANLGRALVLEGRAREGLPLWAQALEESGGRRALLFDPLKERYELAQAALVSGQPQLALGEVRAYLAESEARGAAVPGNAHCLLADSLDAVGQHAEAEAAAARCPAAQPTAGGGPR